MLINSSVLASGSMPTHVTKVTAIIPARNEAECIGIVIRELLAQRTASGKPLLFEVVVADNGSTDATARIARDAGARVIFVAQPGYGRACWEAVQASVGDVLLFVDGDGAADPREAAALLAEIEYGAELVIGVRQHPDPASMSAPQRWGNRLACVFVRLIWRLPITDLGPYRAIRRTAFDALRMRDRSYGWTVEMQVRAHVLGLRVAQRPVQWHARVAGHSKISGTLRGVIGAGLGILGMIARLWWRERRRPASDSVPLGAESSTPAPLQIHP